jgi:branched-chain amino acid transport system permease protein
MTLFIDILIGGAILGSLYSLVSVGLNLQYGVTRILNVAHGDFLMIGAYLTFFIFTSMGFSPFGSIVIVGPFMFLIGYVVYTAIIRRVVKSSKAGEELEFRSLLLCFGLSFVVQNIATVMWTSNYRGYEAPALGVFSILGTQFEWNRILIAAISIAINLILFVFLKFTRFGVAMRATVDQPVGSQLCGINTVTVCALSFSLGILLAAWAGTLISVISATINPYMGSPYTMIALVLVIMAGIGSFKGNIVSGFIIGYLSYITLRVIDPSLTTVVVYAVLIIVLLIKPKGLFAR